MSSARYKTLLSYLPGMASVVNSFQSEQVQIAVFDRLITALEERAEFQDAPKQVSSSASTGATTQEVVHDIVEGESIHAELSDG